MMNASKAPAGATLRRSLAHVLWVGGPSDAGKTTVARLLVQRRRWQWYPCDLHEHNHLIARPDPVLHPAIYQALGRSSEVAQFGLPYIEVDGQRTAEEIADAVQSHFASYPAYV